MYGCGHGARPDYIRLLLLANKVIIEHRTPLKQRMVSL